METIKLRAHIGSDGILKLEMPTNFKNVDAEVVIVLQPTPEKVTDGYGWPVDYFEVLDALEADDIIERPPQGDFEERETIE
ncbi:MAG: hypothetical protein Q9P01_13940 [Anaerolineae bacterium]|nr:hypothetical protein [Anaerolineae bacterium]MDQ7035884.1 hypothetical protein [Anaerolineae bacterium]